MIEIGSRAVLALALGLVVCGAARVGAAPKAGAAPKTPAPKVPAAPEPWKDGVSPERQQQATALFEQGNELFEKREYARAVELYASALAVWDHPQIHFNMMVALVNLDRVLEAYPHAQAAVKYGAAGLEKDKFLEAQTDLRLLEGRVVAFSVATAQAGVQITFDGKVLLAAPGQASFTTLPGAHALVATSPGFEPMTKNLVLVGGQPARESIELSPRGRSVIVRRRFRSWVPWTVAGAGAGAALLGAGLIVIGDSHFNQYDAELASMFPNGATPDQLPASFGDLLTRARIEHRTGVALATVGGGTLLTGLVMIVLNQPRAIEVPPMVVVGGGVHDLSITWLGRF